MDEGSRRAGGQVDKRTGADNGRTGGQTGRTVEDGFPKGKTPKLTRQLTWPLKIQHGRPRLTVQL